MEWETNPEILVENKDPDITIKLQTPSVPKYIARTPLLKIWMDPNVITNPDGSHCFRAFARLRPTVARQEELESGEAKTGLLVMFTTTVPHTSFTKLNFEKQKEDVFDWYKAQLNEFINMRLKHYGKNEFEILHVLKEFSPEGIFKAHRDNTTHYDHQRTSLDGGIRRIVEHTPEQFQRDIEAGIRRQQSQFGSNIQLRDDYNSLRSITEPGSLTHISSAGSPLHSRSETPTSDTHALSGLRKYPPPTPSAYEEKRTHRNKKQAWTKEKETVVPAEPREIINRVYPDIDSLLGFIGGEEDSQSGKKKGKKSKRKEVLSKSHSLDENALGEEADVKVIGTAHSASSTSVEKKEQEAEEKQTKEKNPKKASFTKKKESGENVTEEEQVEESENLNDSDISETLTEPIDQGDIANYKPNFVPGAVITTEEYLWLRNPQKYPCPYGHNESSSEAVTQKKDTPDSQKKDSPKLEQRSQSKEKELAKSESPFQKKEIARATNTSDSPVQQINIAEKSPFQSSPPSSPSVHTNAQEEKLVNGLPSPKVASSSEFITVTNRKKNKFQKPVEPIKGKPTNPQSSKVDTSSPASEKERIVPGKAPLLKQSYREPLNVAKKPQSFDLQTIKKTDKLGNKSDTYASHVYTNSARKPGYRAGSSGSVDVKSQPNPKPISNNPTPPASIDLDSDPPLCPIPKHVPYRMPPGRKSYLECARSTVTPPSTSASSRGISTPPAQSTPPTQSTEPQKSLPLEPKDQTKEPVEFCGVNFDNKSDILTKPDVEVEFGFGVSDVLQAGPGAFKLEKSENIVEQKRSIPPLDQRESGPKSELEPKVEPLGPASLAKSSEASPAQSPKSCATPVIEKGPTVEASHYIRPLVPETIQSNPDSFVPGGTPAVFFSTQGPPFPGTQFPNNYPQVNMMSFYQHAQQSMQIQQTTGPIMSTMPSPSINSPQISQHQAQIQSHGSGHGPPGNPHPMSFHPQHNYPPGFNMNPNMILPQGQPGQTQHISTSYQISIASAKQSPSPLLNSSMNPYMAHYQNPFPNYTRSPNQPVTPPSLIPNINQNIGQNVQHYVPTNNPNSPQVPVQQSTQQGSVHIPQHHQQPQQSGTYSHASQQLSNIRAQHQPTQQQRQQTTGHPMDLSSLSQLPPRNAGRGEPHPREPMPMDMSSLSQLPPRNAGRGGRGGGGGGGRRGGNTHYTNDRNFRGNNGGSSGDIGYRADSNVYHRHVAYNHYPPHYSTSQHSKKYEDPPRQRETEPEHERGPAGPGPEHSQPHLEQNDKHTDEWESGISISQHNAPLSNYYREPEPNSKYDQYSKEGQEFMERYADNLHAKAKRGIVTYRIL